MVVIITDGLEKHSSEQTRSSIFEWQDVSDSITAHRRKQRARRMADADGFYQKDPKQTPPENPRQ